MLIHSLLLIGLVQAPANPPKALPRVLFLTHSAGFMHDVVRREKPELLSFAEAQLTGFGKDRIAVECTQDCGRIRASELARFDAVMFYTTGELPIPDAQRKEFIDWIRAGHAFIGVHCATDTLYQYEPYQAIIGGAFDGHPWHEKVRVNCEDTAHPATAHLGKQFEIVDEIYQFRNYERKPLSVLLSLDTTSIDASKGKRADKDYALSWTRPVEKGRLFYTALGHRPEVWEDPRFQQHLLGGIEWAVRESRKAREAAPAPADKEPGKPAEKQPR